MLRIACEYCDPEKILLEASPGPKQNAVAWAQNWKATLTAAPDGGPQFSNIRCACGAVYGLEDDGVPASAGGIVKRKNMSAPVITKISSSVGPVAGGKRLGITGIGLDVGQLTVSFGGAEAEVVARTSTNATIISPAGVFKLNVVPLKRLVVHQRSGNFTVGETLSVGAPGLAVVRDAVAGDLAVEVIAGSPAVGDKVAGKQSGTIGVIATAQDFHFSDHEMVVGRISAATGYYRADAIVSNPSGPFAPGEVVVGNDSGAMLRLGAPAFSGRVDVVVSNEFGVRGDGSSKLEGAFTFS